MDFGTVLNIAGPAGTTGLTTSYRDVAANVFYAGRTNSLAIFLNITFDSAPTPLTSVTVRLVGRHNSTDTWRPLQTSMQSDTEETAAEHVFARATAATWNVILKTDSHQAVNELQLQVKHTGGTSTSEDVVTATAEAV